MKPFIFERKFLFDFTSILDFLIFFHSLFGFITFLLNFSLYIMFFLVNHRDNEIKKYKYLKFSKQNKIDF